MSSTNVTLQPRRRPASGRLVHDGAPSNHLSAGRLPTAALSLLGVGLIVCGVTMPWVSMTGGPLTQSGQGTRNGNILLAAAGLAATLAAAQLVRTSVVTRWLLTLTGFAATAFAGYLLIQLYTATESAEAMALVAKGPGLYVAIAGSALVFATTFLPMPAGSATTAATDSAPPTTRWGALGSRLRFPVAVLAVVAGLAHVPVTPAHLNEAPYIGVSFLLLTVACVVLAAALLISDRPLIWAVLGVSCLLAVLAYVVSRTTGLPLIEDDIGQWFETLGVVSVVTETGVAVIAALALTRWIRTTNTNRP